MINGVSVALPVIQTGLGSEKTVVTKMGKGNIQVKGLFSLNTELKSSQNSCQYGNYCCPVIRSCTFRLTISIAICCNDVC